MFILREVPSVFIAGELPFIVVDVGFNPLPPCDFIRQMQQTNKGHQRCADARDL